MRVMESANHVDEIIARLEETLVERRRARCKLQEYIEEMAKFWLSS